MSDFSYGSVTELFLLASWIRTQTEINLLRGRATQNEQLEACKHCYPLHFQGVALCDQEALSLDKSFEVHKSQLSNEPQTQFLNLTSLESVHGFLGNVKMKYLHTG